MCDYRRGLTITLRDTFVLLTVFWTTRCQGCLWAVDSLSAQEIPRIYEIRHFSGTCSQVFLFRFGTHSYLYVSDCFPSLGTTIYVSDFFLWLGGPTIYVSDCFPSLGGTTVYVSDCFPSLGGTTVNAPWHGSRNILTAQSSHCRVIEYCNQNGILPARPEVMCEVVMTQFAS
jgi:hypothetical protein